MHFRQLYCKCCAACEWCAPRPLVVDELYSHSIISSFKFYLSHTRLYRDCITSSEITDGGLKLTEGKFVSWVEFHVILCKILFIIPSHSLWYPLYVVCLTLSEIRTQVIHRFLLTGNVIGITCLKWSKVTLVRSVCVCSPAKINIYCFVCLPAIDLSVCPST